MEYERIVQPFEPIFDKNSKILILGSLPSVKSRENGFYYGHPQNRFWKVVAGVYGAAVPETVNEKKDMLYRYGIAVWDVIESCDIKGAADSSIKNVVVADLKGLLDKCQIKQIYGNGGMTEKLYKKYVEKQTGMSIVGLPSTSPANAAYSLAKLMESWQVIRKTSATHF